MFAVSDLILLHLSIGGSVHHIPLVVFIQRGHTVVTELKELGDYSSLLLTC